MSISVCLASYNGELFIEKQISSILKELSSADEIIIVDDCSNDNTIKKINSFDDPRIKLYSNEVNSGEVYSFNKAILLSVNQNIFLSDQDDIWIPGRVEMMLDCLNNPKTLLVSSNFSWINNDDDPITIFYDGVSSDTSKRYFKNVVDIFIGKTNYFGCAMAFKKDLVPIICPIPSFIESHDLWIAKAGNIMKSNAHLNEHTFFKRKHDSNVTSTISDRSLMKKFLSRIIFLISIVYIYKRKLFLRFNK